MSEYLLTVIVLRLIIEDGDPFFVEVSGSLVSIGFHELQFGPLMYMKYI